MHSGQRLVAEGAGTAFLVAGVVGSGIMAERLSGGNAAIALLANAIATGATLVAIIVTLGPVSGGHFNPAVTLMSAVQGSAKWPEAIRYVLVQLVGAVLGVFVAHGMFSEPLMQVSARERSGGALLLSECVATVGLLVVVLSTSRRHIETAALAVGLYIVGAYWFTASTAFANPAVTVARALTDTFAGIRAVDAAAFVAVQLATAVVAAIVLPALIQTSAMAEAPATKGRQVTPRQRVLVLCTGNSARSQMAEGLLRSFGRDRFEVFSAGTKPSHVRAEATAVMAELGIDLSSHRSKHVAEFDGQSFDYVITVCDNANESCPAFPGRVERLHWSFPDPAAVQGTELERLEAFRGIRDALATAILAFVAGRT